MYEKAIRIELLDKTMTLDTFTEETFLCQLCRRH